jgi:outer membrane lipoprotein-sorting protein
MNELPDSKLDEQLRTAMGPAPTADFDAWRSRHGDALAHLNPVVTAMYHRRRQLLVRLASAALAAAIIAPVAMWVFVPQEPTFAQTINAINKAESISWTIAWYDRITSEDGNRTWLRKAPRWERSYLAPSRWRDVRYDEDGTIASVDIEDATAGKVLHLDMKKKEAMLKNEPSGQFGPGKPFEGIANILESKPIEFAGQREVDGVKVNVFRHQREVQHGGREGTEIWLDAESKRLVGYCNTPGNDFFDPATTPDRDNPPEERFSKGTIAGVIHRDIVFDAQLDPALFSLTPPEGFTIVEPPERPTITEDLMIEWLRLSARANDGVFIDLDRGFNLEWHNAIEKKEKSDRSEAEQQYMTVTHRHILDGNYRPVQEFADEFTESRSFRYLGKGVKLGSGERIVCFYKLKSTGKYRAVYGDLSVKDVEPKELPLPVE